MAQRIPAGRRAPARRLTGLFPVLFCLLAVAWMVYFAPLQAIPFDLERYTIYNDQYDAGTPAPEGVWEITQTLSLTPELDVYGVRLLFDTAGVVCRGSLTIQLESPDGQVLAAAGSIDAGTLLDGDFQGFAFSGAQGFWQDNPHISGADYPQVVLRLVYKPDTDPEAPQLLRLWYGGPQKGVLTLDGRPLDGALALQWMTGNASGWVGKAALLAAAPLALAAVLGWLLLRSRRGTATAFAVTALLLGLAFALVTPVQVGPDEYAHLAGSYGMVNRWLGQPGVSAENTLAVRACDAPYLKAQTGEIGPFAYKEMLLGLTRHGMDGALTYTVPVRAASTDVWYLFLPQALGILAARALGLGFHGMVLLARLTVLAVTVLLAALAVRAAPDEAKPLLFCIGLLPMSLQMASCLSTDGIITGLAFCLIALCLAAQHTDVSPARMALLWLLAVLLAPAKTIYILVPVFCLIIPPQRLGGRRRATVFRAGTATLLLGAWMIFSSGYFSYIVRDVDYILFYKLAFAAIVISAGLGAVYWKFVRGNKKLQRFFVRGFIALGVLGGLFVIYMLANGQYGLTDLDVVEGIQANGDSVYTYSVGYILHHLPVSLRLLVNSVALNSGQWLQGLLGLAPGEPIVYPDIQLNWVLGVALVLVLAGAALPVQGRAAAVTGWRCWLAFGIGTGVVLLCLAACYTWTPINYTVLFGFQGRYLLPVLPLLLLPLGVQKTVVLQRDVSPALMTSGLVLAVLAISQTFLLYCRAV